jgi:hypothetical protein
MFELKLPSDEEAVTLPTFASAVFRSWCGLMTGGIVGIAFAIWALIGSLPAILFGAVGAVAVFIACYMLWRDERHKRFTVESNLEDKRLQLVSGQLLINKLTSELTEVKEKRAPDLKATIDWISSADTIIQNVKHSAVTIQISISNLGMASVVTDWIPTMTVVGKEPLQFQYFHCTNELTLSYLNGSTIVIKGKDMIYEKTSIPLQTGSKAVGYLHFRVPFTTNEVMAKDTIIQVFFSDVIGKSYDVIYEKNKGMTLPEPSYVPGVETRKVSTPLKQKKRRKKH